MIQGTLATRLRVLRARRGLSLTEAGKLAGIQRQTLAKLERGERERPHDTTLAKLAVAYDVPVEELLEEQPPDPNEDETKLAAYPFSPQAQREKAQLRPETDNLVDMSLDEFSRHLEPLSVDELMDLQWQLYLLVRYRYGPRSYATMEEMVAYIQSAQKRRGDKAGLLLRRVFHAIEARADALSEARESSLSLA